MSYRIILLFICVIKVTLNIPNYIWLVSYLQVPTSVPVGLSQSSGQEAKKPFPELMISVTLSPNLPCHLSFNSVYISQNPTPCMWDTELRTAF